MDASQAIRGDVGDRHLNMLRSLFQNFCFQDIYRFLYASRFPASDKLPTMG
jgi:hypothetical protein